MPKNTAPEKPRVNIVHAAFLVVIAVIIILILLQPKQDAQLPINGGDSTNETEELSTEQIDAKNFNMILPSEWSETERAENNIQFLGEGQRIEYSIIEDPINEDIVYFATSAYDNDEDEMLVSIYSYNTSDYTFERIFRTTYERGDSSYLLENQIPVFHVLGYDSGSLVLLIKDVDDSPGEGNTLLLGDEDADEPRARLSMEIDNPYGGFSYYELPEEVRAGLEE